MVRDLVAPEQLAAMETECVRAQQQVVAGELSERYGSTVFLDDAAKAGRFANYVEYVSELSPAVATAASDPELVAIITALLGFKLRWPLARYALVMLAGTIPTMSFLAEHFVTRQTRRAAEPSRPAQPV